MKKTPELFDIENNARKNIEFQRVEKALPEISVGDIRWYYVGLNIGQEISKDAPYMRPCLILGSIENTSLIRIVPLTTKRYPKHKWSLIELKDHTKYGMKKTRMATHHIGSIDKKRLIKTQSSKRVSKKFCRYILKNL